MWVDIMKKTIVLLFLLLIFLLDGFGVNKTKKSYSVKTGAKIEYDYIAANEILMWVANDGDGSQDPDTWSGGYYWPREKNSYKTAIYEDGLIWGGYVVDSVPWVNGSTYRHGCLPGAILEDGTADDPTAERNRIFKIRKDWESLAPGEERDQYEKDYYEWPGDRGAPYIDVNGDGKFTRGIDKPDFIGDEVLWWVMNDLDTATSTFVYGAPPIGLEVQVTVWAFSKAHLLGDVVFKKYKIINKGNNFVRDMYVGYWADVDLGDANDDYVGCDTTLSLGYCYNAHEYDDKYGVNVPAVGHQFLETPVINGDLTDTALVEGKRIAGKKNTPLSGFALYIGGSFLYRDADLGNILGSVNSYNNLRGKLWDGSCFVDPNTGDSTAFCLAGDPVSGKGWYEGDGWPYGARPADRRYLISAGPFDFAPGDTQIAVIAIPIASKDNNIQSLALLKDRAKRLKRMYSNGMFVNSAMPDVSVSVTENSVMIYWDDNVENKIYPNLNSREFDYDSLYKFEGYGIYQFGDINGNDPIPIYFFDKKNDINELYKVYIGDYAPFTSKAIDLNNDGIMRYILIDKDYINNSPLFPSQEYYFGVSAIYSSEDLDISNNYTTQRVATYIESKPRIMKIIPSRKTIDYTTKYSVGENLFAKHIAGNGDGYVNIKVIDPSKLTGGKYKIIFHGFMDSLKYSLIYEPKRDTLIWMRDDIPHWVKREWGKPEFNWRDSLSAPIVDGFQFWIRDIGNDSVVLAVTNYKVKDVLEVEGEKAYSVWNTPSPNGNWQITAKGPNNRLNWQAAGNDAIGYNDYEIRFLSNSQYFLISNRSISSALTAPLQNSPLGIGRLPYEIWDIGRTPNDTTDDKRLAIKILDFSPWDSTLSVLDSQWTQLPNGDWEEIYAFEPLGWNADDPVYPKESGSTSNANHKFGALVFRGDLPKPGTVIRITTWKPLSEIDTFVIELQKPNLNDKEYAKKRINEITAFPNPFYGILADAENNMNVTFTNLPTEVTIRIYSLSGHLVRKLHKKEMNPFLKWDLRNENGLQVASGIYIAYLDMPGIGEKILKIAVIF